MVSISSADMGEILGMRGDEKKNMLSVMSQYYASAESSTTLAEVVTRVGATAVSLTSAVGGSSANVILPTTDIIQNTFLQLTLPAFPLPTSGALHLARGWAFLAIDEVSYTCGSSNNNYIIKGIDMLHKLLAECSKEKADFLLDMAGKERILNAVSLPNGEDWEDTAQYGIIQLAIPASAYTNNPYHSKGIHADLLTSSISLTIKFNTFDKFISVAAGVNAGGTTPALLTSLSSYNSFSKASVIMRQANFYDANFSLKPAIMNNPDKSYKIPFHALRSAPLNIVTVTKGANGISSRVELTLNGIESADLESILFSVVRVEDIDGSGPIGAAKNPLRFAKLKNVKLFYNGQNLFLVDDIGHLLISQVTSQKCGKNSFSNKNGSRYSSLNAFDNVPYSINSSNVEAGLENKITDTYLNDICLSYNSPFYCSEKFDNSLKYINGSLNLSFDIDMRGYDEVGISSQQRYYIRMTYVYPSILSFSSGVSSVNLMN